MSFTYYDSTRVTFQCENDKLFHSWMFFIVQSTEFTILGKLRWYTLFIPVQKRVILQAPNPPTSSGKFT